MHPVLLEIGSLKVYSYGFMMALGVAVSLLLVLRKGKREGIGEEPILDLTIVAIMGGLIGARLFYVIFYGWDYYSQHLLEILDFRNQGLVWYGSFIVGAGGALLYLWIKKLPMLKMADLFAPYVALGYAFGRIGCFLNGCCYGKPTSLPWGVQFPGLDLVPRHPTQIYSSLAGLALFVILLWLYPRRRFDGQVFLAYIIGYAVLRFIIEFFRENLIVWAGLSFSQVVAAGITAAACLVLWYLAARSRKA